jgi:hypothetical protein
MAPCKPAHQKSRGMKTKTRKQKNSGDPFSIFSKCNNMNKKADRTDKIYKNSKLKKEFMHAKVLYEIF